MVERGGEEVGWLKGVVKKERRWEMVKRLGEERMIKDHDVTNHVFYSAIGPQNQSTLEIWSLCGVV